MNNLHHTLFSMQRPVRILILLVLASVIVGCTEIGNMKEQDKYAEPYDASDNGFVGAAYDLDPNAVPVGFLREDTHFYEGKIDGEFAETFPESIELTEAFIMEGQRQYDAFCSPCHGYSGYGDGVVVQEGLPAPPSYHDAETRSNSVGLYFDIITNGGVAMFSYDSRVTPEERWAIIAYIRTMQFSQNAPLEDLPDDVQTQFFDAVGDDNSSVMNSE